MYFLKKFKKYFFDYIAFAFKQLYVKVYIFSALIINILAWLLARFINKEIVQNLVVLHYNVDFGVDLIGDAKKIYIIPLLGLIIIFINFSLSLHFKKNQNFIFISHLLLLAGTIINLFLLGAVASVYLINFT